MPTTELEIFGRRFRIFYARAERVWTAIEVNAAGDQLGDAQFAATRDLALVGVGIDAARPRAEDR
jgi:hypothetical protein